MNIIKKLDFNTKKVYNISIKFNIKNNTMITDKIISISDLRTNATNVIKELPQTGSKYIFVHNKPKAVLVDIDWYDNVSKSFDQHWIEMVEPDEWEKKSIVEYEKEKKQWTLELIDSDVFFKSLK